MKKINTQFLSVILWIFTISNLFAQDINVTFKVDMAVNVTDTGWRYVGRLCAYSGTGKRAISIPNVNTGLDAATFASFIDGKNWRTEGYLLTEVSA